jgi:NAD(P)-dependent dehydrogenase (short-subunit alcohol dehydrogenase family)
VMDVNFRAVVAGCRAALPLLRKTAAGQGRAWLVNISSVFGMMGYPTQTAYCASKFAVRGFTETLRIELGLSDPRIEVVQVHPGGIKTNIARSAKFIRGLTDEDATLSADRFDANAKTTPAQAAKVILDGMEKARTRVLIGPDARFIDWMTRLLPSSYFKVIGRLLG